MLDTFKALTSCDNDLLAQYFLEKSMNEIKDYTRRSTTTVNDLLKTYVIELAVVYYNRRGAEGLKSQSFDSVSETFSQGMPRNIKTSLNTYRYFVRESE